MNSDDVTTHTLIFIMNALTDLSCNLKKTKKLEKRGRKEQKDTHTQAWSTQYIEDFSLFSHV